MTDKPSHFTIRHWSIDDPPREKMQQKGAQQLSNAELLALLIGSGNQGESAVHLMQRLLSSVDNNILELHAMALEKMMEWKGIGLAKAVKIKAALELGKRIHLAEPIKQLQCNSIAKAYQLFQPVLSFLSHEEFWVAYLNHQNKVITRHCLSKGGIASTTVDLRLLLKKALEVGATGLLLAHNHPTGNLQPSKADISLTEKIKVAAQAIDIQLLDHLIVSENGYFSFADENTLKMLLVFCQKITPRVQYTFKHVFTTALGVETDFTSKLETFIAYNGPKMSYGKAPLGNEFFIEATPLLFEFGVQEVDVKMKAWKTYPSFFEVGETSAIPFDLFAATFYLISRYEEYLPHVKDSLNRFDIKQSLCVRKGFAQTPLVDLWLAELLLILKDTFPDLVIEETSGEKFMPIIEVVSPYKYLHQSVFSNLASLGKAFYRLNFWELLEQPLVLLGFRKDPWDTFQEFKTLFYQSKFKSRFFFLFSKGSDMDRGISIRNTTFKSLIKAVADYLEVGLLASFPANKKSKQFEKEREGLKSLIHREIQKNRYAWGISTVNESYRNLLMQEVEADFSLGFPLMMGYRASTAVPFFYYDLANEMTTSLKIFPVVANGNSLRQYSPVEGIKKLNAMGSNLPLSSAVHCFAINNQILENSEANKGYRTVIIDYLMAHDK